MRLDPPDVRVDARYDTIEGGTVRERLQGALRVEQRSTFFDTVDLVLFVATGDAFSSRWVTLHDFRPGEDAVDPFRPHLRQVYLQVRRPRFRLQLGAIPPVKAVISPTGLDPAGWIDGARFEWYNAPGGTVEFVAGRLGSIETPSVFARPFPLARPARVNYGEVEVSQHVRPWLRLEGSVEYLHDPYVRSEVRWIPSETEELFAEVLYNLDTGTVNYGTTLSAAPFSALLGGNGMHTTLELRHAFKGEEIGLRGVLSDDFVTFGHSITATLTVHLARTLGLRGRVEGLLAEWPDPEPRRGDVYTRLKVGIGWRLP